MEVDTPVEVEAGDNPAAVVGTWLRLESTQEELHASVPAKHTGVIFRPGPLIALTLGSAMLSIILRHCRRTINKYVYLIKLFINHSLGLGWSNVYRKTMNC